MLESLSIMEWIAMGVVAILFLGFIIFTWRDLILNRKFYVEKSKNVTSINAYKRKKKV